MGRGWIGVDLDGTLAHYDKWVGPEHIGKPIAPMVELVKHWLATGKRVKIFTARVAEPEEARLALPAIEAWCEAHIGQVLEVTRSKDFQMVELYDDRCVQVEHNTGRIIG